MASQTGGTPKWFLPSVRDQMLSEIRVAKSRKLAPPHSLSTLENPNQNFKFLFLLSNLFFWLSSMPEPFPSPIGQKAIKILSFAYNTAVRLLGFSQLETTQQKIQLFPWERQRLPGRSSSSFGSLSSSPSCSYEISINTDHLISL